MVQTTDKSGTSRLMIAVFCLCNFCGLVAEWFRRQTKLGRPG